MASLLPAAFADINIDKSWSVYYWLARRGAIARLFVRPLMGKIVPQA
jgi:hypothetical protein